MKPRHFEVRVCANPDCGLRFPYMEAASPTKRCPICLGDTEPALEAEVPQPAAAWASRARMKLNWDVLLDNVRSAQNVGSILRTAEGLGIRHVYLGGITPTPERPDVQKASLGAERSLDWSHHNNGLTLAESLKRRGHAIWVLESSPEAAPNGPSHAAGLPVRRRFSSSGMK